MSVYEEWKKKGAKFTISIRDKAGVVPDRVLSEYALDIVREWLAERPSKRAQLTRTSDAPEYMDGRAPDQFETIWVESVEQLEEIQTTCVGMRVGIDVETARAVPQFPEENVAETALDPHRARVRLVQVGIPGKVWVVDAWTFGFGWLQSVLDRAALVVAHNMSFEWRMLTKQGIQMPDSSKLWCTMLANMVLEAGKRTKNGLDDVALAKLGIEVDKTLQNSDWGVVELSDDQKAYAALDAHLVLSLAEIQESELIAARLERVFDIEMGALQATAWMCLNGVGFDTQAWTTLAAQAEGECDVAEREIAQLLGKKTCPKTPAQLVSVFEEYGYTHVDPAQVEDLLGTRFLLKTQTALRDVCDQLMVPLTKAEIREIVVDRVNPASGKQLLEILQDRLPGRVIPNTDEDTLHTLEDLDPIVGPMLRMRKGFKSATTYGRDFLKFVNPVTKRLHGDFKQMGADTGRMSCEKPNLQNVPSKKSYRACFSTDPRRRLVKADYSQIELRIAAVISQDFRMLAAYNAGEDLHRLTAALVLNKDINDVTKEDRQIAKSLNFGLLYGMGAAKLQVYALTNYGVRLTLEEAQQFRNAWLAAYQGVRRWHRSVRDGEENIYTLSGRRRQSVDRYSQKLNTPVQGTGGDGIKLALWRLYQRRHEFPDVALVLCVHDEIVVECDEENAPAVREWLTQIMVDAMREVVQGVPIEVEAQIGRFWGDSEAA